MKFLTGSAVVALQFACASAFAQTAPQDRTTAEADAPVEDGSMIIVTGTRDRSRTQFDTLSPIDVLSADAVQSSVSGDLSDTLAQLLPSFNVQRLPAADGQAFVRPATLRGLSADQTLVLVNGKRYHRSALLGTRGAQAPDLAGIPSLAIGRIEVLRDGASAQYGSDAIAGVINILLDDTPGMTAFSQFSQYYKGDGKEYQGGVRAGVPLDDRGSIVVTAEIDHSEATSRTRQRPDAIAFQAANPGLAVPNPVQRWGQPDEERLRGGVDAKYEFSDAATLYAFGTVQSGEGVTDFNWRNPSATASVYNASTAFPGFSFKTLYPTGFTPRFATNYSDYQGDAGLRGSLSERLTYDLSASLGRSRIEYSMTESLNASMGPASPTSFYLGRLEQREFNLNADFVYRLPIGGAEPLNIAFGAERRVETYQVSAGDPASYTIGAGAATGLAPNSNGFPGFSPASAGTFNQTSHAGYVDLEWRPVTMLTLGAAGRYEDFSAFGDTFNYKLSARIEPVRGIAARATYSTGFRAPTPAQLNTSQTTQGLDTNSMTIYTQGRLAPNDPLAIVYGAKPLTPETSKNLTLGLTAKSDFGLSASVDLYQIDLNDRFSQSRTYAVPAGEANPQHYASISFFTNDFDTRTRGIDVVLGLTRPVGPGRATATIAYNYNTTKVQSGVTAAIPNETQRRVFEERLPQNNATGALGYDLGPVSLLARARYYGAWTDVSGNATGEQFQRFGAIALFDLSASWRVDNHLTLRAGAENIFNTYPAEATNQAVRGLIYSRNAPYDTDGGQYYVRMGLTF
ncbi:TonB-dependent receptor plug domain-containing protein [Sphingomonas hengshuiensis]|uniref:TonB-dependent receptor n=1 Tax=Sphingomonas hengshuiensis TaxID=1609977 RepID=A0A7U4J8B5_9SPHN|nr:TonB-dependent receptor [Sphingomonas hengshuiensis]AJP72120.1 TonB-dependent receptor [Sphingomonas hengshuiensis]